MSFHRNLIRLLCNWFTLPFRRRRRWRRDRLACRPGSNSRCMYRISFGILYKLRIERESLFDSVAASRIGNSIKFILRQWTHHYRRGEVPSSCRALIHSFTSCIDSHLKWRRAFSFRMVRFVSLIAVSVHESLDTAHSIIKGNILLFRRMFGIEMNRRERNHIEKKPLSGAAISCSSTIWMVRRWNWGKNARRIFAKIEIAWAELWTGKLSLSFHFLLLFIDEAKVNDEWMEKWGTLFFQFDAMLTEGWMRMDDDGDGGGGEQIPNCHFLPS